MVFLTEKNQRVKMLTPIEEVALFPVLGQCKINLPLHSKVIKCNPFYW